MSDSQVIAQVGGGATHVRAAIARASEATGVDFKYLLAQARLESSLDPGARAATSSAAGLYQFTQGTWLQTMGRHAADHGMAWVNDVIAGGNAANPALRSQVLGLRYDADTSALMAAELANDNKADLTAQLGREPDATELYLAHFLGSAGAGQFLSALATDPTQSAAAVLPKAAAANHGIFYAGGAPRSVGGVMALLRDKVAYAMDEAGSVQPSDYAQLAVDSPSPQAQPWQPPMGPIAREFHASLPPPPEAPQTPYRSMAETLQSAFGGSAAGASTQVRSAYAKLARFGL